MGFETIFVLSLSNFFWKNSSVILVMLTFETFILIFSLLFFFLKSSLLLIILFLFIGILEAIFGLCILLFVIRINGKESMVFF